LWIFIWFSIFANTIQYTYTPLSFVMIYRNFWCVNVRIVPIIKVYHEIFQT
jgi:hypothetical protein